MNDDRKRFMFDFIADSLYSIGEAARRKPAGLPPEPQTGPITIRIWDGEPIADAGHDGAAGSCAAPPPPPHEIDAGALPTPAAVSAPAVDGWMICTIDQKTYRARLRAGADPALWPAAHVEAEHCTPRGWREVKSPDTLIALYRLLTGREATSA